jgi:hypothetical protein
MGRRTTLFLLTWGRSKYMSSSSLDLPRKPQADLLILAVLDPSFQNIGT